MTQPHPPIRRRRHWKPAAPAAIGVLAIVFAAALLAPLPMTPNGARAVVVATVEQRLPGWHIERVRSSWEGAWSVVATCGALQLGFQMVPGHGLPAGDAWIHPEDRYAQERLGSISDSWRTLIWYADPIGPRHKTLNCNAEMARLGGGARHWASVLPGLVD